MTKNKNDEPLTLDEIHHVTLDVLKKIQEICKEHQITYFVAYGSLIGAVRHKGFIPWDDDFDIMMLRPDYDRFCAICNESINGHGDYALMNPDNNKDYPFNISRFCDLRYRMVRDDNETDAGMGIFIDIYPLDGLGNDISTIKGPLNEIKQFLLRLAWIARSSKMFVPKHNIIKKIVRLPIWMGTRLLGGRFFYRLMKRIIMRYDFSESKYVGCFVWDADMVCFPKKYFEGTTSLQFEGIAVDVPKEYDKVLRISYGDYMKLPPEENQHPTHGYQIFRKS